MLSLLEFSSFLFLVFIYFFFKHTLLNLVNICWLLLPLFTKLQDLFLPDFSQLYLPCRPDLFQVVSNYSKQKSCPGLRKPIHQSLQMVLWVHLKDLPSDSDSTDGWPEASYLTCVLACEIRLSVPCSIKGVSLSRVRCCVPVPVVTITSMDTFTHTWCVFLAVDLHTCSFCLLSRALDLCSGISPPARIPALC